MVDGRYEVVRVFEHGGMGLVYRVRHLAWGTDLAVKCPRPELFRDDRDRERFVAEAQAWVSLGMHQNVCVCHYVRTLDGIPRVFAEYVSGGSLADWVADRRLYEGESLARILDVAVQTAWGLGHAHDRGLVHQDVKPANVLLDGDGTAKVTDFGLARPGAGVLVPSGGLTRAYASPEQANGEPLGRRSDIFSFAVSVLELFTGGVTWLAGPVADEALAAYLEEAPEPGLPAMPPDLADLLARCLNRDPADRPDSMARVADALIEVYQRVVGRTYPRPAPEAADLRADELNNRALSLLDLGRVAEAAEAFTSARAADPRHLPATYNAGLTRWRSGEITDEELVAELEAVRADAGNPWQARHLLAQVHMERGDLDAARTLLAGLDREAGDEPDVATTLRALRSGQERVVVVPIPWYSVRPGWTPPRLPVQFTPDGRLGLSGDWTGVARLWDLHSGQCLTTLRGHEDKISSVAITPDGRLAMTAGADHAARLWDLTDGRCLRVLKPSGLGGWSWIDSVHLSDDGRVALAAANDGPVFDVHSGQLRFRLDGHEHDQEARRTALSSSMLELSRDGRIAISGGHNDKSLRVWDVATGAYRVLATNEKVVSALRFSQDARTVTVVSYFDRITVLDVADGRLLHTAAGHSSYVDHVSLSPDGRFVLAGGADDGVRLWDLASGRCLRTFRGHEGRVGTVLLGAGVALSGGEDNTVRRWPLPGGFAAAPALSKPRRHLELGRLEGAVRAILGEADKALAAGDHRKALDLLTEARTVPGHERDPRVVTAWRALGRHCAHTGLRANWSVKVFSGNGSAIFSVALAAGRAAAGCLDRSARVWDVGTGECLRVVEDRPAAVDSVGLSVDGRWLLTASRDGEIGVWSVDTGANVLSLRGEQTLGARTAIMSPAGGKVLTAGLDQTIRLWDVASGQCVRTMTAGRVAALSLGASGRLAASAGGDGVRLWDLDIGERVRELAGAGPVTSACLSADERLVLAGGNGLRLWDAGTGECLRVFGDPGTRAVRFTADGRFAVSGGESGIALWDVHNGQCLRRIEGHEKKVNSLALSADDDHLLSGGDDTTTRLWALDWELAPR